MPRRYRRILADTTADTTGPSWSPKVERTYGVFKGKARRKPAAGRWCPNLCHQPPEPVVAGPARDPSCGGGTKPAAHQGQRPRTSVLWRKGEGRFTFKAEVYA